MKKNQNIMIIEDSAATAMLLKDFLNQLGYTDIHVCIDATTAMAKFSELYNSKSIPLIFLDYNLPGTDTISLFKELLKMVPETKIIVATISDKNEYGIKYLTQHGAYHYLQKPFSLESLKQVMEMFEKEQLALE